jgi:hypothetical protein
MSAYLVEPQHITEIVKWASNPQQGGVDYCYNLVTKEQIDCDPKQMVMTLAQANIDSLVARYEDDPNKHQSIFQDCLDILQYSTDGASVSLLTGVGSCDLKADDIYNMVQCLEYQSCEVDNWVETDAYWLLNAIKDRAGYKLSKDAEVSWSFNSREVA